MTVVVDAGPLIAYANGSDPESLTVDRFIDAEPGPLIVPAPVTAEVDHLLQTRWGTTVARRFIHDLALEVFRVECLFPHEYTAALELDRRYSDLRLGLADLSVVVLARRFDTRRILTFDQRHFRAVEPLQGGVFSILPDDEPA